MNHLSRLLLVIMVVMSTAVVATAPAAGEGFGGRRSAGHWIAREATPPLGGDPGHLLYFGTECPSATTCVSLGYDDGPVARSIVAGRETTVRVSPPADSRDASAGFGLGRLSCASATFCMTAGDYYASDGDFAGFFASWDGATWRTVRAPAMVPNDDSHGGVESLSCGAPGSCTAVTRRTIFTLAGGRWTAEAPLPPAGTDNLLLERVSCASATSCVISGYADADSGRGPIVIVRRGRATTSLRLANPPGWTGGDLGPLVQGLDCAAPQHCVMEVGATGQPLYLVTLNGTRAVFHRVPDPVDGEPNPYVGLDPSTNPISCPTVSTCWVIDTYFLPGSEHLRLKPVAVQWHDGAVRVSALPEPSPRSPFKSRFTSLDCPSATSCVAVGSRRSDHADGPYYFYDEAVAVSLHRGIWRALLVPAPTGAPTPRTYYLTGVACGAPARCTADGEYQWDLGFDGEEYQFAHQRQVLARLIRR